MTVTERLSQTRPMVGNPHSAQSRKHDNSLAIYKVGTYFSTVRT